jgi:hypothetical protein
MAKQGNQVPPTLTVEQAAAICGGLLPIADQIFGYAEELRRAGFRAFVPRLTFLESFCVDAAELDLHRRCVVETAREKLGRPWPMSLEKLPVYESPFLHQLREERDRLNGCPEDELTRRYSVGEAVWRRHIDPAERRKAYTEVTDREAYTQRWEAMLNERADRLREEATSCANELVEGLPFGESGRYTLFRTVMERDAAPLGFKYDQSRSRRDYPLFSCPLNRDWALCWAIENKHGFIGPRQGHFEPMLEVRSQRLRGKVNDAEPGEVPLISYQHVVTGFGNAYWQFYSFAELSRSISAHLFLFGLMKPIIEASLSRVLGGSPTLPRPASPSSPPPSH